jgi:D-serine deaminase-like pyridoxal phosphate-dependent protein
LIGWSRTHGIAWRPAYKTLRSPGLLAYVLAKLDRPRVMIHHLRDLPQALPQVPDGTDFLMGYPPTLGELRHYLSSGPGAGERRHILRINVDGLRLLRALDELSKHTPRKLPIDVVLEIYNGIPRGGFDPGAELTEALKVLGKARGRLLLGALLCYDAFAVSASDEATPKTAAQFAQRNLTEAHKAVIAPAHEFVDLATLVRNGPGSANYTNWAGTKAANEFSAGSAVLFANYLDPYRSAAGLAKGFTCAPRCYGCLRTTSLTWAIPDPGRNRAGLHQVRRVAHRQQPNALQAGVSGPTVGGACLRPRLQCFRTDSRPYGSTRPRRLCGRDSAAGHGRQLVHGHTLLSRSARTLTVLCCRVITAPLSLVLGDLQCPFC